MSDDAIKARLRKYLELSRRGEGGERENAEKFLRRLLTENGLRLEDLDDELTAKVEARFVVNPGIEERIVTNVICCVLAVTTFRHGIAKCRGKNAGKVAWLVQMTPGQRLEAELMLGALMPAFQKKLEQLATAFIATNKLYAPSGPGDESKGDSEFDPITEMEARQIAAMMHTMTRTVIPRGAIGRQA
ncbi:hypothetical protein C3942_00730 [Solimonas fluminis]|uniref:DUF2786 domain-containing protein n=1 Tax=Solimonas fluminis TaxID=2086571 RepID=A0A2S5TKG4_9GAMM|nr:hypothetical protein [Solimonas fluminis]PPE75453.1 hypothetical protein C3942_00730 [Solimonas fluminis]